MKSFLLGALGTILVLTIAAVTIPLYSDYRDKAQTTEMLESLADLQSNIAVKLSAGIAIKPSEQAGAYSEYIQYLKIFSSGALLVKGGNSGQVFVLIPSKADDDITWNCIGGNNDAMPPSCRDK